MNHTTERIRKLNKAGLTPEQIARKIGRPGDIERVLKALRPMSHERGNDDDEYYKYDEFIID